MMIHPESLHKLERQTHAEMMRQSERHRIALAARPRRPGWLSFRRYPRATAVARRWWDSAAGFFTRSQRPPAGIPAAELGLTTMTVTSSTIAEPPSDSSLARSR